MLCCRYKLRVMTYSINIWLSGNRTNPFCLVLHNTQVFSMFFQRCGFLTYGVKKPHIQISENLAFLWIDIWRLNVSWHQSSEIGKIDQTIASGDFTLKQFYNIIQSAGKQSFFLCKKLYFARWEIFLVKFLPNHKMLISLPMIQTVAIIEKESKTFYPKRSFKSLLAELLLVIVFVGCAKFWGLKKGLPCIPKPGCPTMFICGPNTELVVPGDPWGGTNWLTHGVDFCCASWFILTLGFWGPKRLSREDISAGLFCWVSCETADVALTGL